MMRKCALLYVCMLIPSLALACSHKQPTAAFIEINDKNRDQALSLEEWQQAYITDNMEVSFKMNDAAEFKRLDINQNGLLRARELGFESVKYKRNPCENMQAKLNTMGGARALMH
ncbi:UDP-glucose 6-dehydrogenase [Wielerella bovis]|uniref:UDP-glucose 6-dehydrogenase n=1 Tax=Wielerella bovis TaxID=2917790 RepID=UPI002018A581|nr:UDP-glucose 6-dehydrogenase [Wielerella bovis]ULJ63958.1 UDP-glucose 6-dehydrogenase [Wielerella bovis]ULJ68061.1 UDP-glucose 6-dehydrogenase [Wielerella bovis]